MTKVGSGGAINQPYAENPGSPAEVTGKSQTLQTALTLIFNHHSSIIISSNLSSLLRGEDSK